MADDQVLVVNGGRGLVVEALLNLGAVAPAWLQWGVGSSAPAAADTDLTTKTDCNEARVDGTGSDSQEAIFTYRVKETITKSLPALTGAIIRELGTFNADGAGGPPVSGGTMFIHAVFDAISLNVGNAIEFTVDTLITAT